MWPTVLFCLLVGAISGALVMLDVLSSYSEPREAIRTKEIWCLWIVNAAIAMVIAYSLIEMQRVDVGFLAGLGLAIGYPVLLHTKILTVKSPSGDNISLGFELLYEQFNKILLPGMEQSIRERGAHYLTEFKKRPLRDLGGRAKDYITTFGKLPPGIEETPDQLRLWVDKLIADEEVDVKYGEQGKLLLFTKVRDIGGYRGIRHCLK